MADSEQNRAIPRFTARQKAFLDLWGKPPFRSQAATAKLAGVKPNTVSDWLHDDPAFAAAVRAAREDGMQTWNEDELAEIRAAVADARKAVLALVYHDHPYVSIKAATWIWDRAFGKPTERHEHTGKDGEPIEVSADVTLWEGLARKLHEHQRNGDDGSSDSGALPA